MGESLLSAKFDLSYRVFPGSRGCLILLHGMMGSHSYFVRPLGGRLGGFRLVLPDLLGHGDSSKPESPYTLEDHLAPLRDLLEIEGFPAPLFLGGHSLGGVLAAALADSLPGGSVAGLVLLNLPWFSSALQVHEVLKAGSPGYRRAVEGIEVREEADLEKVGAGVLREVGSVLPRALQADAHAPSDAALAGTARHCLFSFRPGPVMDRLARLPMLIALGGQDRAAPSELVLPNLPRLSHARFLLIEDAGHHLLHTHADRVVPEISRFLADHPRG